MAEPTTSRHLRGASEVLLLPKIQRRFVDNPEQILSFASRLKLLLSTLFELRRVATDQGTGDGAGPIERLRTVYDVQWTVLEEQQILLVAASFDRSWEDYFRLLYEITGPLLDALFLHCEGYRDFTNDFEGFSRWVRETQKPCDLFYLANPELTTDDQRYQKALSEPGANPALVRVDDPDGIDLSTLTLEEQVRRGHDVVRAVEALFALRKFFPKAERLEPSKPEQPGRDAQEVFDIALAGVFHSQRAHLRKLVAEELVESRARDWIAGLIDREMERLADRRSQVAARVELQQRDLHDIQGGLLTDYAALNRAATLLVRCDDLEAWKDFLNHMNARLTTEDLQLDPTQVHFNLGLTYRGLERLGVASKDLAQFPAEFREGMQKRAGLLGDLDDVDYPQDTWPVRRDGTSRIPISAVDAVVLLQVKTNETRWYESQIQELEKLPGVSVLAMQDVQRELMQLAGGFAHREPFGYLEGNANVASQPVPNATLIRKLGKQDLTEGVARRDVVALGEILLGYPDQFGETPERDRAKPFFNGTFLVIRKLEQRVGRFNAFAAKLAKRTQPLQIVVAPVIQALTVAMLQVRTLRIGKWPRRPNRLWEKTSLAKAWMMGRTVEAGEPLAPPNGALPNDFDFDSDEAKCPFFAHIRRANPRTLGTPRILRRRYTYGKRDSEEYGTFFMAYNASIAGQYEVIQRWINGGNSTGIHSAQRDLIAGQTTTRGTSYYVSRGHGPDSALEFAPPESPLVRLLWGMYLFVPSRSSLEQMEALAHAGKPADPDPSVVKEGNELLTTLRTIVLAAMAAKARHAAGEVKHKADAAATALKTACKQVLEEPANFRKATAVWAAIRAQEGQHPQGYVVSEFGTLVGTVAAAQAVLGDPGTNYSVRGYASLMKQTLGEHYLSFDEQPDLADPNYQIEAGRYSRESVEANAYFQTLGFEDAYQEAFAHGRDLIDRGLSIANHQAVRRVERSSGLRTMIYTEGYAEIIVARWAQKWLGLSYNSCTTDETLVEALTPAVVTSRCAFQSDPADSLMARALATRDSFAKQTNIPSELRRHLDAQSNQLQDGVRDVIARGATVGFAAPAIAAVRSLLDLWAESEELWALAETAHTAPAKFPTLLKTKVIRGLAQRPIPTLLYRTAVGDAKIGDQKIAGQRVFVGLGSVYADAVEKGDTNAETWLFGGAPRDRYGNGTRHGCPAREAALGVLAGAVAAILIQRDLRREHRFVLSCARE